MDQSVQKLDSPREKLLAEESLQDVVEDIRDLIARDAKSYLKNILLAFHAADIARVFSHLNDEERNYLFQLLDPETAAEVIVELDQTSRLELLETLDKAYLSEVIGQMDSDDATDVVSELSPQLAESVLKSLSRKDSAEVRELLAHEKDTAGGIMAKEIVAVNQDVTVDEAIQEIRRRAEEVEPIYNVYAVDDKGKLVGVVPLKQLLLSRPGVQVRDIMNPDVIAVHTDMDQEEVARIVKRYDLVAVPVVDQSGRLVGRVTVDDVVDVMEDEVSEDISMMAGVTDIVSQRASLFRISRTRLPWLLIAFTGEIIAGFLMSRFQTSFSQVLAVVFFVPLIMALGGNVGNQSAVVTIRAMATGEIDLIDIRRRLFNEIFAVMFNGLFLAILIFSISFVWLHSIKLGLIISLALIIVMLNAAIVGSMLPFIFRRLGIDPAVATSPFISTSNDILGVFIYFALVSLFLKWFG
ncbi:MAG TPA: magnesium transporter [Deltaproteobacteria bacterium]|nr:magnesium transporter [Deltaproteobacteria bacterium]